MQGRQENEYLASNQDKVKTKQFSSREGNRRRKEMKRNWRDKEMSAAEMKEGKMQDVCAKWGGRNLIRTEASENGIKHQSEKQ